MFRSLQLNRSVAAVGLFAVCVLLVVGVRQMARAAVRSSPAVPDSLTVAVRSGARGMRVRNLTDESWEGCVVTIEGGVSSMPFAFTPEGVMRLPYESFRAGTNPLDARADGFSRAFHMTAMGCRDAAGHWQSATFR